MLPTARRSCALPALLALAFGCDQAGGCNPGCAKCEEAIAHMTEKVESFGCNPTSMENAVERIEEDCEQFNVSQILGAIVEECNADEGISVACRVRETNFRVDFFIDPTTDLYAGGVDVHLELDFAGGDSPTPAPNGEFPLGEGESVTWTERVLPDSNLGVSIIDPADPEHEITFGSEQLVVRESRDYWTNFPTRTVVLTESDDGLPIVEFQDFRDF